MKNLWTPSYRVYVFAGRPGMGKTTAALHLVAYDLRRRGVVDDYREALREAGKRLFTGRDLEELFEYILDHVDSPEADWLIIDDAAVGFHDFADPLVWAKFMDIVKTARNSIARRGVIITTTSLNYLSARIRHSAHIYYVKQEYLANVTRIDGNGGCTIEGAQVKNKFVAVVEMEFTFTGQIHHEQWHEAKPVSRWRLAGAIPISPEFAMPPEVEEVHIRARKERVRRAAEEALERIRRRRENGA
jgi:RecA/RadA recombinase